MRYNDGLIVLYTLKPGTREGLLTMIGVINQDERVTCLFHQSLG